MLNANIRAHYDYVYDEYTTTSTGALHARIDFSTRNSIKKGLPYEYGPKRAQRREPAHSRSI